MYNEKLEHAESLQYFWTEKGNMERYVDYEEVIDLFPDIKTAYEQYKYAKKVLNLILEDTVDNLRG